jgi:hypothetical protein
MRCRECHITQPHHLSDCSRKREPIDWETYAMLFGIVVLVLVVASAL